MEQVMNRPKVTVITVCYNAAADIEVTLESVLGQTAYDDMEVIVIDGGSTDGTVEKIRKYDMRLARFISEPDKGIYNAMNKGIALSTGEYVNFMNAGDRFFNSRVIADVLAEVEGMQSRPDVIYGATVFRFNDGYAGQRPNPAAMPGHMGACHQSVFVDGDMIRRHLFDESYRISADFELLRRLYMQGAVFAEVNKYVSIYNFDGVSGSGAGRLRGVAERRRILGRPVSKFLCRMDVWRATAGSLRRDLADRLRSLVGMNVSRPAHRPLDEISQL